MVVLVCCGRVGGLPSAESLLFLRMCSKEVTRGTLCHREVRDRLVSICYPCAYILNFFELDLYSKVPRQFLVSIKIENLFKRGSHRPSEFCAALDALLRHGLKIVCLQRYGHHFQNVTERMFPESA